jgi:hypothetical protein
LLVLKIEAKIANRASLGISKVWLTKDNTNKNIPEEILVQETCVSPIGEDFFPIKSTRARELNVAPRAVNNVKQTKVLERLLANIFIKKK